MKRNAPLLLVALIFTLASAPADTVTWDGGGDGTRWFDPLNWDTDALPTTTDDVVVPDLPGDVTILHDVGGNNFILSLNCQESLNISAGAIRMTAGASTVAGTLQLGNATAVQADGAGTTFTASGPANIDNALLDATNGGVVTLTNLTTYTRTAGGGRTLTSSGPNSLISLPNLTTIDPNPANGWDTNMEALNGGRIEMPALTTVADGSCRFRADGASSSIQLTTLSSFDGYLFFTDSGFRATNGGDIDCPALTTIHEAHIQIDATSTMDTAQIVTITGDNRGAVDAIGTAPLPFTNLTTLKSTTFRISGNVPTLPALSNINDGSIIISNGLTLSLPLVTDITIEAGGFSTLQADGAGTVLSFPNLTAIDPRPNNDWDIQIKATAGGRVEMPAVTIVDDGAALFVADGANSTLQLSTLSSFDGYLFFTDSGFRATNGGDIDAPVLATLAEANLQIDATSTMQTAQITSMTGGGSVNPDGAGPLPFTALTNINDVAFNISANVPTLPALTNIDGGSIILSNGLTLSLPGITAITVQNGGFSTIQADGAGTVLSFPNLTTIDPRPNNDWDLQILATAGGRVEMPALTSVDDGAALFSANGTDSTIQLTNLATFDGYLFFTDSGFRATNGGNIDAPALTSLFEANFQIDATSTMQTAQITSFGGGGTLDVAGAASLPFTGLTSLNDVVLNVSGNLPTFPNLSNIDGTTIVVSGGLSLSLPLITDITVQNGGFSTLQADGAGSVLSFPNLTIIDAAPANDWDIQTRATSGGVVEMPALTTVIDGSSLFVADGADSILQLTSLTSFNGYFFFTDSGFRATNGGLINFPPAATVDLTEANIQVAAGGIINGGTLLLQPSTNISGDSTIEANVLSHGLINPGPTFGTLTIDGDFTQFNDGNLTFEIGGLTPGTTHDQLVVTGNATFDGTFTLNNSGAFAAFPEDEVTLLNFNSAAGSFPTLTLPSLGTELAWAPRWFVQSYKLTAEVTAGPWVIGDGTGWEAEYYDNNDFTNLLVTRTDPEINFSWGGGSPDPSIGGDTFSARWCASLLVPVSQDYTFYTRVDDGVRLWIDLDQNGTFDEPAELVIDFWIAQNTERASAPIPLTAGEIYNVKMEYFEQTGGAVAILQWEGANITKSVIPTPQVYLKADTTNLTKAPTVSPVPDTYQNTVDVTLASTGGAAIHYTTDGSDPTIASPLYSAPLTFTDTTTIKARAFGAGLDPSPTLIARYVIEQELPDLIVTSITPLGAIAPGQTVNVEWAVQNVGIGPFNGTRVDSFAVSPDDLAGGDVGLAFFSITDALAPGESRTYQRSFTAPFETPNGDVYLVATTDANDNQAESDQNNNATVAGSTTNIPALLTLTTPLVSIAENAPAPDFSLTLSRNGDIASPLTVDLAADLPGELNFPASIDIPIGSYSTTVPVNVINDGVTDGDKAVTVTASSAGYAGDDVAITVIDANPPSLALSLTDTLITEGSSTTLRVTRNPVTASALVVDLSSSAPSQITNPVTATIPADEAFVDVFVAGTDDTELEGNQTHFLFASAPGHLGASAQLAIVDDDVPALALSISPATVSEADGALAATATITRNPVSNAALTIELTNSDPSAATLASPAVIPAFSNSVDVPINATDDPNIDGPQTATIQAILRHPVTSEILAQSTAEQLTVTDDEGPTLTITLSRDHVSEGETTTATVRRQPVDGSSVTVNLSSGDPAQATVPATLPLGPGVATANFDITGVEDGADDGTQNVVITAGAASFNSAQKTIAVTDESLPDLIVTNVALPASASTEDLVTYSYRLENTGSGPLSGSVLIRTYLSDDQQFGNDTFLNQYLYEGGLPEGFSIDRSETFIAPIQSGDRWLIVQADAEGAVEELVETNNLGISVLPITLEAAYTATVSTDTDTAPAGTPIDLTGSATDPVTAGPAPFVLVNIHICVQGTCRIIAALTDANGNFATTWTPLPGEAGVYTIGAAHPSESTSPEQDSFTLLGLGADPSDLTLDLLEGAAPVTQLITLTNLGDVDLTDLTATVNGAPAGLNLVPTIGDGSPNQNLAGLAEVELALDISVDPGTPPASGANVQVSSSEGATVTIPIEVTYVPATSQLVATPGRLDAGMVPGSQAFVDFDITNRGALATGGLTVVLPVADWLSSATATPLPPLGPGETSTISLQLCPPSDLPLDLYEGTLLVTGASETLTVAFGFRALSTATGDLVVKAEDELTYYAEGNPFLAGATVQVLDGIDGSLEGTGTTDADGEVSFPDLTEGYYDLVVTADQHTTHRSTIFLKPGQTNIARTFLAREAVRYIWTVLPTTVEDRTVIIITTEFETNVPLPVVTVEPSYLDLTTFTEDVTQVNFKITNHGLIAAQAANLSFTSTAEWKITPLIGNLGDLPALSSVTVPVTVEKVAPPPGGASSCANPGGRLVWELVCGNAKRTYSANIAANGGGGGNCAGGGRIFATGGGGGGAFLSPRGKVSNGSCDPCLLQAGIDCIIGYLPCPISCPYALARAAQDGTARAAALASLGCVAGCADPTGVIGAYVNTLICFDAFNQCQNAAPGGGGGGAPPAPVDLPELDALYDNLENWRNHSQTIVDMYSLILGDPAWLATPPDQAFYDFLLAMNDKVQVATEEGNKLSASEAAELLALPTPANVTPAQVQLFVDRWNRSLDYWDAGILTVADVPGGQSTDFIPIDMLAIAGDSMVAALDAAQNAGFNDPVAAFIDTKDDIFAFLSSGGGVCARVVLEIKQEAVITRDAFEATLQLVNDTASPITNLSVDIEVTDLNGQDVTGLFGIGAPTLENITGGDTVGPNTTGILNWSIIPSPDAAPTEETLYFVAGTLGYSQDGLDVTVPLASSDITVFPSADLKLKYFQQRDVFSDDPFTPIVEPSVPFSLAVSVENLGAGAARNLRITSGQPEIIENEKGLFINFNIIAAQLDGQPLTPSLTVDFGDVDPGETKTARWLMTSSLHGHFIGYEASFEHVDALGETDLSLINSVEIHEMIHEVLDPRDGADALPDFLTNDLPDPVDLPDTVHLSDGTTAPVSVLQSAAATSPTTGTLAVPLTATMPSGFAYLRIPEPSDGSFRLTSVMRSDGKVIPFGTNIWTTDRTFIDFGLPPIRENILHLFDHDSTGSYTLFYAILPPPDQTPPSSQVNALPADSFEGFTLSWSGTDNVDVAFFDVFFSVDGGPFTPWLEGTSDTSALFEGDPDKTYAFFSVATDTSGNRESAPAGADTSTMTTLTNTAPILDPVPNQDLTEGDRLLVQLTATDPDASGPLTWSLEPGAPTGVTINANTGLVSWFTGETDGGRSESVTVVITDAAWPFPTATQTFTIDVADENSAPVLPPQSVTAPENTTLEFNVPATDQDIPVDTLTFRLGAGAPAGVALDPATGELTWDLPEVPQTTDFIIPLEIDDNGSPVLTTTSALTVTVQNISAPPSVLIAGSTLAYTENDGEVRIDSAALVTDPDSLNFDGGSVSIALSSALDSGESLTFIEGPLTNAGDLNLIGNTLSLDATLLATFVQQTNTSLVINLSLGWEPAHMTSLLRHLAYSHPSEDPTDGMRQVSIVVDDGGGGVSLPAVRLIEVTSVDDPPVAGPDFAATIQDTSLVLTHLLANDSDVEGDAFSMDSVPANSTGGGTLSRLGNTVTYTPFAGFTGTDTFAYTLLSSTGATASGTVTIDVSTLANFEPFITEITRQPGGTIRMTYRNAPSRAFDVWGSPDLLNWTLLDTVTTGPDGTLQWEELAPRPEPDYFYRWGAD